MIYNTTTQTLPVYDIDTGLSDIDFESYLGIFDISHAYFNAEKKALEAYKANNYVMNTVLESQIQIIKEEAEESIWEKVKRWFNEFCAKMSNLWNNIKNFLFKMVSTNKQFLEHFKAAANNTRTTTGNYIDISNCLAKIQEYTSKIITFNDYIKVLNNEHANHDENWLKGTDHEKVTRDDLFNDIKKKLGINDNEMTSDNLKDKLKTAAIGEKKERTYSGKEAYECMNTAVTKMPTYKTVDLILNKLVQHRNEFVQKIDKKGSNAEYECMLFALVGSVMSKLIGVVSSCTSALVSNCRKIIYETNKPEEPKKNESED